ncbi:hypothetical protein [Gracilimonas sp. BCB1]|uniref:hypothetical protein n=1 Tax=Gracilimonas sp. BCB1 TaxID=3152362 RepID=UPI0032D955AE
MFDFDAFLETLKTDLTEVVSDFGEDLKDDLLNDAGDFAFQTKEDLIKWSKMLKDGEISADDFEFLLKAKKDLAEMEALKQRGLTQAKLDKLKLAIMDTVAGSVKKVIA